MDEKYLHWLHEVTLLGYDEDIILSTEVAHLEEAVKKMYENGMPPKEAIEEIKKMING